MKIRYLAAAMALGLVFTGCNSNSIIQVNLKRTTAEETTKNESNLDGEKQVQTSEVSNASETIRWMNAAYAINTTVNGGDLNLVGGFTPEDITSALGLKKGLKNSWDISTREEADQMITWLVDEGGHNQNLLDEYNEYEFDNYSREELEKSVTDLDADEQAYLLGMYDAVQSYGENAITAWDLSRAMQLLGWYYVTGMYTYEETMDKTYEIAEELQTIYPSWDDMMASYFYGFQYWNEDDPEDTASESYNRRQIYETLKMKEDSPYNIPWNLQLQKEW